MQAKNSFSSWIQLGLFTGFLFLLVAIPYTIYLKSSTPQGNLHITSLPVQLQHKINTTPSPTTRVITPPPASTTTSCVTIPKTYTLTAVATPSSYLVEDTARQVCFPPVLPPFPFTWNVYKDYQHGITFDTPNNWITKTVSQNGIIVHSFYQATPTATTGADLSFAWFTGQDPYATDTAYLKQNITKNTSQGTIYTKGRALIQAVFPDTTGYFLLQASTADAAFYAFQHMLISITFNK